MARIDVVMPKMGESVMEGTVLTWFKQPGENIDVDEALLEIGTDKVDSEIPSPASGTVAEILVPEGDTVDVGTVLARLETDADVVVDTSSSTDSPPVEEEASTATPDVEPKPSPGTRENAAETVPAAGTEHVVEIVMPKMGESVMEGTVLAWFKKPGENVDEDEALLEIGTDKVDSEIPSPATGVLTEIFVEEGTTVDVGTVLATLSSGSEVQVSGSGRHPHGSGDPDSVLVPAKPGPTRSGSASEADSATSSGGPAVSPDKRGADGRFYSPLVRSIAREEGLSASELEDIPGSGRDGRVTKQDVLSFVAARGVRPAGPRAAIQVQAGKPPPTGSAAQAPFGPAPDRVAPSDADSRVEVVEMDRIRQVVAEHMTRSLATSAHVTSFAEADVTNLVRLRDANKAEFLEHEGVKLTYTPFFVKASVDALREHPLLNSSVDGHRILVKKDFHIGIAVAIDKTGLVVPVIRFAGGMNVAGLAHAAADLADRARNKQLQPDDLQGGSFTVTNVGSLGSIMGTPIINQPQVAVLATGAITKRAVVKEHPDFGDVIVVRNMMYLSLSYDHRIIDGAMAASFLQNVVSNLESIGPGYDL